MALLNQYQDSIFALSLRRLFSSYSGPLVRVIRESDLVEVDILPDSNGEVSYDSFVSRPIGTDATTLGEFLNIDGYTDVDSLGEVYQGRLIKIYDQSVGANHVFYLSYSTAFLFVEHSLPAQFPNSTNIIKVNNIPSFFSLNIAECFTSEPLLERELSLHFLAGQVAQSQNPLGFRVMGIDSNGFLTNVTYDILLTGNLSTVGFSPINLTDVFDVNNVYLNSEQCVETQNNVFEKPSDLIDDTTIATIEFKFLSSAESYGNFADSVDTPKFYIISNGFYTDLIVYEGYDNTRRLFIEDLYATAANNVETKAFTSSLVFDESNTENNGFLAQFPNAAAAYSVRSLTGNTGTDGPKVVRVRRDSDNVEVDVYTDDTGFITLDSPIANTTEYTDATVNAPFDTSCTVLGQFVNNAEYDDIDNLGSPDTATVVAWYDQSATDTVSALPTDAAAAYSVRKLFNGYSGSALKIRRDSDNATQDIGFDFDGNLDVQAIEDFVREGVVGADYPSDLLLDIVPEGEQSAPEAAAAYSLRRLRSGYGFSPLIRVRRDSDHAEADVYAHKLVDGSLQTMDFIGLDSIVLATDEITNPDTPVPSDEVTLMDFARGANLTVVVWYDQAHDYNANWYNTSTDQNNAVQEIGGNQPKIYDEFTGLITENGKPAIDWTGDVMTMPASVGVDFSIAWVWRSDTVSANQLILNTQVDCYWNPNNVYRLYFGGSIYDFSTSEGAVLPTTNSVVWQNYSTSETWYMRSNGAEKSFAAGPSYTPSSGSIGQFVDGRIQEIIIWNSNESDNREKLEKNINNAYEIYGGWRATVETWYDQANNNHATQADELSQPTIYDNGGVVTDSNGDVTLDGDATTLTYMDLNSSIDLSTDFSVVFVGDFNAGDRIAGSGSYPILFTTGGTSTTGRSNISDGILTTWPLGSAGSKIVTGTMDSGSSNFNLRVNGAENNQSANTATYTIASIFYYGNNALWTKGSMKEIIIYDSSKYSDRTAIEKNINSYYNIYIDNAATQQVAGSQPTLVSSGELVKENGKAALSFINNALWGGYLSNQIGTIFSVLNPLATQSRWIFNFDSDNNPFLGDFAVGFTDFVNGENYSGNYYIDHVEGSNKLAQILLTGTDFINQTNPLVKFGSRNLGEVTSNAGNSRTQELIIYPSNQTENRFDIESNINSAFQIYSAAFPSALDTVPEAKAAYSVRRLTKEYVGPIITVDNGTTTKDFYADFWGNLDKTALTEFANSNPLYITKWWDQSGREEHLVANGGSKPTLDPSTLNIFVDDTNKFDDNAIITDINNSYDPDNEIYLLDEYDGAAAAYSLRKLRAGYDGPLVRVRKDGDNNAEVDVYPDANGTISTSSPVTDVTEITDTNPSVVSNETTFGDFMSGYDGKVVVWYDQSADFTADWYTNPNSQNNAVQDVSGSQPKVYDSVTGVVTKNGKPALLGVPSCVMFLASSIIGAGDYAVFTVHAYKTSDMLFGGASPTFGIWNNGGLQQRFDNNTTVALTASYADGDRILSYQNREAGTWSIGANGGAASTGTNTASWTIDRLFAGFGTTVYSFVGKFQEFIAYESDQSANRSDIERDINRHYQMYDQTNRVVAVHGGDVQRTVDLNVATYTDLKEIIHYQ